MVGSWGGAFSCKWGAPVTARGGPALDAGRTVRTAQFTWEQK